MNKIWNILFFTFCILLLLPAQTVKDLEEQRKAALRQLEATSKVLSETQRTQRTTVNKLNIINKSIQERRTLINNIDREIRVLDQEMQKLEQETRRLERQLAQLKAAYAETVREAHIDRSIYNKIMFVLSAESFDQSFRRLRYLQEIALYRKQQAQQIQKTQETIAEKAKQLSQHKQTQIDIRKQQESAQKQLVADQRKESTALTDLRKRETTLRADLRKQQQIANELNRRIEQLIAEEIRKAEEKRKAEEQAQSARDAGKPASERSTTASGPESARTREMALVSGNFASNSGRLPWPVEQGFISGKFGVQPHPVLRHVTTNNKGIYIQTPARSNARAVFEGVVTQRFSVPGSNNGVIIQHGDYRTVYANLTEIYVRVGQKVSAKQNIGRIYTDPDNDNKTELFFQIWKDRTILNPERWIAK